jgi:CRP/FNR family cyclic AMP-dependent transcriptional regulator
MKIKTKILAKQPFLRGMSKSQLEVLMEDATFDEFLANEVIFKEGAPANWFYLVLSGEVALESSNPRANNGRNPIRMQTLGAGEVLGWSWLYPPYSWQFTARTLTPVKAIFFYGSRLRECCEADHELGYELMKRTAETAVKRLQVTRQRVLKLEADAEAKKVENKPAAPTVIATGIKKPASRQRNGPKPRAKL